MTQELDTTAPAPEEEGREITAKFARDELVRGWREREPRQPRAVPIVRIGVKTDLGRIRENNEDKADFYEPEEPAVLAARGCLYAVADGMGGHAAGQIASEVALKTVIAAYYDSATEEVPMALLEAISAANEYVHNLAVMIPERSGMGTTLTVAVAIEDRVYVGQVGDSRAYLIRDGAVRQVTQDHSWVAEQVRMGGLTEEEAEVHPYRNIITRSIGTQSTVEADVFEEEARAGDVWVLCSDGLSGHVSADEIRHIASTQAPSEAARQLVELANARGGRDNITVLTLAIRGLQTPEPAGGAAPAAPEPLAAEVEFAGPAPGDGKRGILRLFGK